MTTAAFALPGPTTWLARFGRHGAARRFATLLAQDTVLLQPAMFSVEDGLHAGARLALAGERCVIGSDADCDIVLQDNLVRPRHAIAVRQGEGFELRDAADAGSRLEPLSIEYGDGMALARYDLQGVHVSLSWPGEPEPAARPRMTPRAAARALAAGVLLAVGLIGGAEWLATRQHAHPDRAAQAIAALGAALPPGVLVRLAPDGVLEADGLVADDAARTELARRIRQAGFADMRLQLRSAALLIEQLREALGAPELQLRYDGQGRVRVEGTTEQMAVKQRLGEIAAHRGRDIDDRVVLLDGRVRREAASLPLPVRITDVMLAGTPYFRADDGGRYYLGAVLPDGAEVVSIDEHRILFRRGGKNIAYHLE